MLTKQSGSDTGAALSRRDEADDTIRAPLDTRHADVMLRTALICLAIAIALLLSAYAVLDKNSAEAPATAAKTWTNRDMDVMVGLPVNARGVAAVRLDQSGRGVVEVATPNISLAELPYLQVRFRGRPDVLAMIIGWRTEASGRTIRNHRVGLSPGRELWLDMGENRHWQGQATSLAVVFLGPPGGRVDLETLSLRPRTIASSLRVQLDDWLTFVPWRQSSINAYIGVMAPGKTAYPVVVLTLLFIIASMVYLASTRLRSDRSGFRWSVVGVMFTLCWIALDSLWQYRLMQQVKLTAETFAGKTREEKLLATNDDYLFRFAQQVHQAIPTKDARVFINTTEDYVGMRSAYYLYPMNVFWERHAKALPASKYFQRGDYIVLLNPALASLNTETGELTYGTGQKLKVRAISSTNVGALLEVI